MGNATMRRTCHEERLILLFSLHEKRRIPGACTQVLSLLYQHHTLARRMVSVELLFLVCLPICCRFNCFFINAI
jgi:hypothetical protein